MAKDVQIMATTLMMIVILLIPPMPDMPPPMIGFAVVVSSTRVFVEGERTDVANVVG